MVRNDRVRSFLADSMRAHAWQFSRPLAPAFGDAAGTRILVAFLAVGVGIFFLLRITADAAGVGGLPATNLAFVLGLLAAFVVMQRFVVRLPMADVGLRPLAVWTRRERLFFLQVVPVASAAFAILFRGHLSAMAEKHGLVGFLLFSVLTGLAWGMAQEFIYRGWLQTELSRRFHATIGLLLANAAFTFGPLHLNYLFDPGGVRWMGLAAVFGIGLLFGMLYRRSGNLWIPAVLHGLWPLNMT